MKKLVSIILAFAMVLTMMPLSVFATETAGSFYQEQMVGDVIVKVAAPEGVFPADATLKVTLVENGTEEAAAIDEAVEGIRDEKKTVTDSYTFDIKVLNGEGEEIQPDTNYGSVAVGFAMAEAEDESLDVEVYHISEEKEVEVLDALEILSVSEENSPALIAEELEPQVEDGEIVVKTGSFSYYVVIFTYKDETAAEPETRNFKVVNYEEFPLTDLLTAVGITGNVLDVESDDEDEFYLEISGNKNTGFILTPISQGVVTLTVKIGDTADTATEYVVSVAVAEREDSEIKTNVKDPGDERTVPAELKGEVFVSMPAYTGTAAVNLTTTPDNVADISITDEFEAEEFQYSWQDGIMNHEFVYNGTDKWSFSFLYYNAGGYGYADDFFVTDVDGLQILPYVALMGKDEIPQLKGYFYDGKFVLGETTMFPAQNGYFWGGEYASMYVEYLGVSLDRDLANTFEDLELQYVYGYLICDADYNYGYVELSRSDVFKYTNSCKFKFFNYETDISYNECIYTNVGEPVDLLSGITIKKPGYSVRISSAYEKEIDFDNPENSDLALYNGSQFDPITNTYINVSYYEYYYNFDVVDDETQETVTTCWREIYIYEGYALPKYTFTLSGDINSYYAGSVFAIPAELADEALSALDEYVSYYGDYYRYPILSEEGILEEMTKYFYYTNDAGEVCHVDPSWVEYDFSYGASSYYRDVEYDSPFSWNENDSSNSQNFYVIFTIGDPDSNEEPEKVSVLLTAYRPNKQMTLYYYLYSGTPYEYKYENKSYYLNDDGEIRGSHKVITLEAEVNNTDFWFYRFLQAMKGELNLSDRYSNVNCEAYIGYDNTLYVGVQCGKRAYAGTYISVYEDEETGLVRQETGRYSDYRGGDDLSVRIVGSLDINTPGKYRISLIPTINGIADEEVAFDYEITVKEKPAMAVTIDGTNDHFFKKSKNFAEYTINNELTSGVTAKTEYGTSAEVTCEIRTASGEVITREQLLQGLRTPDSEATVKEGDILTLVYKAIHPKDASVTAEKIQTLKILKTDMDFSAIDDLTVVEGKITSVDALLNSNLTAASYYETNSGTMQKYNNCAVTLVDGGGFTEDAKAGETFTAVYTAVNDVTKFEVTYNRTITVVADNGGTGLIKVKLQDNSGVPGDDPANFVLGGAGQQTIVFNVNYNPKNDGKEGADCGISLVVHIPYGFSIGSVPTFGGVSAIKTGSYTSKAGTTLTYNFKNKPIETSTDFIVSQVLSVLYPALEDDYNSYVFSAQSMIDDEISCASPIEDMQLVLTSGDSIDNAMAIQLDGTNGTKEYTVNEFFGPYLFVNDDYYGTRQNTYSIKVSKTVGKLPTAGWNLNFALPEGLAANTPNALKGCYSYILIFRDANNNEIGRKTDITASTKDGKLVVPLYSAGRYGFVTTNYGGKDYTYMDLVRTAATVELVINFSRNVTDLSKLVINKPTGAKTAMVASGNVELFNGGETAAAQSAYPIGVILVNGTDSATENVSDASVPYIDGYLGLDANYYGTVKTNAQIAAGTVGAEASMFRLNGISGSNGSNSYARDKWNVYQDLEMTIEYPYEYSPISLKYSNFNAYDVFYTVSNKNGAVYGKTGLQLTSNDGFNIGTGEYVSSITLKWKGGYAAINHNWTRLDSFMSADTNCSITYPTMNIQAAATQLDGSALPAGGKTVTITTTGKAKGYEFTPLSQTVTVVPNSNNIRISADSLDDLDSLSVGENSRWMGSDYNTRGMSVSLTSDSATRSYDNPALILTGNALRMLDLTMFSYTNITGKVKVIGYSVSEDVTTEGPWGNGQTNLWVMGDAATTAAQNNFADVKDTSGNQLPITGVVLDMSALEFGGKNSADGVGSVISFYSQNFWATSPFFDVVKDMILTKDWNGDEEVEGYAILDFSIGFHADGNATAEITTADGKTRKTEAGRVPGSINQNGTPDTLNPFAGTAVDYDLSYMELVRVNTVAGGGGTSYGQVNDCTTVFTSDGTEAGDALMSLVQGLSVKGSYSNSGYDNAGIAGIEYEVVKADGKTETRAASTSEFYTSNSTHKCYYSVGSTFPVTYYPFTLAKGEYVTKVTITWDSSVSNRKTYPSLGLVRTTQLPDETLTGYALEADMQLPVKVDMSYSAWTSVAGDLNHLIGNFTSAKLAANPTKRVTSYSGNGKANETNIYQGGNFTYSFSNAFEFDSASTRLGQPSNGLRGIIASVDADAHYNKLKKTVYYKIDKDISVSAGTLAGSASATMLYIPDAFTDGDGLLKVTYNDYYDTALGGSSSDQITADMRVLFSATAGQTLTPVKEAYLDISYDEANSMSERGYQIELDKTSTQSVQYSTLGLKSDAMTKAEISASAFCMKSSMTGTIIPRKQEIIAINFYPTLTIDSETTMGTSGGTVTATSDKTFGAYCEIISEKTPTGVSDETAVATNNWQIYIPLPKSGADCEGKTTGNGTKSGYNLTLAGPVTGLGEGATVTYTTSANPAFNALTGGTDGADYKAAADITDWSKVTAIHIQLEKVEKGAPRNFSLEFAGADKTAVGDLTAVCAALFDYTYDNNYGADANKSYREVQNNGKYGVSAVVNYELKDFVMEGTVWLDEDADGIKGATEANMEGITVSIVTADEAATVLSTVTTGADGAYQLAVPSLGNYKLKVSKTFANLENEAEAYNLTTNSGTNAAEKSWPDPDDGVAEFTVTAGPVFNIEGTAVSAVGTTVSNINVGVVKTVITAQDFSYAVVNGGLTQDKALKLSFAKVNSESPNGVYTADADQRNDINTALTNGESGVFPLTIEYDSKQTVPVKVKTTVNVFIRDNASEIQDGNTEYITAQSFDWSITRALSETEAKKQAYVSAIDYTGNAYKNSKITIDATEFAALTAALTAENVGKSFPLTFSTPGNASKNVAPVSVTIYVKLNDSTAKKGKINKSDYITGADFTYHITEGITVDSDTVTGELTADNIKTFAKIAGVDVYGYDIPASELIVDYDSLTKLNSAITGRKPGTYKIKVSHTDDNETPADESDDIITTVTINVYLIDDFMLNFNGNGNTNGATMAPVKVTVGDDYTLPANVFERDGDISYTFAGWANSARSVASYADESILAASIVKKFYTNATLNGEGKYEYTLYAAWTRIPGTGCINVIVRPTNPIVGSRDAIITIYQGGIELQDPNTAALVAGEDYTNAFDALDPGTYSIKVVCGTYDVTKDVTITKGQTVTVLFDEVGDKSYNVVFDMNGGDTLVGVNNEKVIWKIGTTYTMPSCKIGSDESGFISWLLVGTDQTFDAGQEVINLAEGDATITFKAQWKTKVTFDANGGSAVTTPVYLDPSNPEDVLVMPESTKTNFSLVGWTEGGAIYPVSFVINSFAGRAIAEFTAKWSEITYDVTFDANGGSCVRSIKTLGLATDTTYGSLPVATRENAEFAGWFTEVSGGTQVTETTAAPNAATTLYAHWTMPEFKVIINGDEQAETAKNGEDYTYTADPAEEVTITVAGKAYVPYTDANGNYLVHGEDIVGDIEITTAAGETCELVLTYMFDGKAVASVRANKTDDYPEVGFPTKDGYTVDGWFDAEVGGQKVSGMIGDGATVLYATAVAASFDVRFLDGEDVLGEDSVAFGDAVTFPAAPVKPEYIFLGWMSDSDIFVAATETGYTAFNMPAADVEFQAVWQGTGKLTITVINTDNELLANAIVNIVEGSVVYSRGVTGVNGTAVFEDIPNGLYSVEVSYSLADGTAVTETVIVTVDGETAQTIIVPILKISTKVESEGLNVSAQNLDDAISEADRNSASLAGTKEIVITLSATKTADDATDPAIEGENKNIKDAMDAFVASSNTEEIFSNLVEYIDLDINKTVKINGVTDSAQSGPITETDDYQIIYIQVTDRIYEALAEVEGTLDNIAVFRMHNGTVTKMEKVADVSARNAECYAIATIGGIDYVVIKAKNFSTYALAVQNVEVGTESGELPIIYVETADTGRTGVNRYLNCTDHIAYIAGRAGKGGVVNARPEENITRAEVAQIFYNLLINKDVEITKTFSDVPETAWYATAVNTIASLGMISGYNDGTFRPEQNITRAEFASIACGFAYAKQVKQSFSDVAEDFWGSQRIATAAAYGWVTGYNDGTFRPENKITRAEAITIVNHMLGRTADQDYAKEHADELKSFPDLTDETKWYYWQIVEAVNAHGFNKQDDKEIWK